MNFFNLVGSFALYCRKALCFSCNASVSSRVVIRAGFLARFGLMRHVYNSDLVGTHQSVIATVVPNEMSCVSFMAGQTYHEAENAELQVLVDQHTHFCLKSCYC